MSTACFVQSKICKRLMYLVGSDTDAWDCNYNDFVAWDDFFEYAINKALDYDTANSFAVLDHVMIVCTI